MKRRKVFSSDEVVASINDALRSRETAVPLLVFRVPEFAERAWSDGKRNAVRFERATTRAFTTAALRVLRQKDLLAHDAGTDWFCVAMLSPSREAARFAALDARAALERIAATMASEIGCRLEHGWWRVEATLENTDDFASVRARSLERGARDRERYEFLATVGHELRTPLTSIRGYIETLLDDGVDAETSRRFLETARREALRLTRLVDGILDFSLLDLHAHAAPATCDVVRVADAALEALLPLAADAGVRLFSAQRAPEVWARIDADACTHVMLNLIENAIKYCARPGCVRVSIHEADGYVSIVVEDDGQGVPADERERVFSYGERGSASGLARGRGVGLAIVRTIVERAGGEVSVERSSLGGARFAVNVPATKAAAPLLS